MVKTRKNAACSNGELAFNPPQSMFAVVNTTDVAIAAAAGAGLRRYVTSLQLSNNYATATEIYAKNGHRPQLLEHLAELFPRHIRFTTAATAVRSCSRRPADRDLVPTWPMTTTARSRSRGFCSRVVLQLAFALAHPSSARV